MAFSPQAVAYNGISIAQDEALAAVGVLTETKGTVSGNQPKVGAFGFTSIRVPTLRFAIAKAAVAKDLQQSSAVSSSAFGEDPTEEVPLRLCYATVTIDRVDNFTVPADALGQHISEVTYYEKFVSVQPWAKDPRIGAAFPELRSELEHLPTMPAKITVTLTDKGWEVEGN